MSKRRNFFIVVSMIVCTLMLPLQQLFAQPTPAVREGTPPVSLVSELKPFYDINDLPGYRDKTIVGQVSSYDTTGGNDDGFSGKYSFLRTRSDSSLVIFDIQGPGVINRIWTPTPSDDSLDFYIDDTTHAAFTIKYRDLFSGKVFPFVAPLCNNQLGGYYCYLPIPFQRRCMIVYRGKRTQFHQIGYRLFPKETVVKNFKPELDAKEKASLQQVSSFWNKSNKTVQDFESQGVQLLPIKSRFELKPGEKHTILQVNKGGRIAGLELEPSSSFEGMLKDIDIKITWDNEANPAVYCPVADFFGYAFGKASMESLLIGTNGNKNYCYFPMPFDRAATIELIYRKSNPKKIQQPLLIGATVFLSRQTRNVEKEGKFYTYWNNQPNLPMNQPHDFLKLSAKGHYVGTVLQARGLQPGMTLFFEGDDSTIIDGKLSMHGTGSEDYFNGGWYALMDRWDNPFSMPLSGSLDYSLPLSRTGGYRLFLSDKLTFAKNFYQSMEHGPEHNNRAAAYTSVAFYYADKPPAATITPRSEETKISIPDTLMVYPQLMSLVIDGDVLIQHRGESFVFSTERESGVRIELQEIPLGNYKLLLDYTKLPQGGSFSLWQRQTPLSNWIDSYSANTNRLRQEYLGDLSITSLSHALTIRFRANGDKKQFYLNRVVLVRIPGSDKSISD